MPMQPDIRTPETPPIALPLPVIYRDDHLIAIHKPAGLLVHRTELARGERHFALQLLRDQINQRVWPVHRLDRGTSGVLLFALDADTARLVAASFEQQRVGKTYLAIVRGHPPAQGEIDHPLRYEPDGREFTCATVQDALTRYQRLATGELPIANERFPTTRYALLRLAPQSGRKHQIRRHLKHISHPILGDATYGKGPANRALAQFTGVQRMLLACTRLQLPHPRREGTPLTLDSLPSANFLAVMAQLGWDASLGLPNADIDTSGSGH